LGAVGRSRSKKGRRRRGKKGKEHGKEYSKGEGEVLEARRWLMADG
jgi:hypothetical protein